MADINITFASSQNRSLAPGENSVPLIAGKSPRSEALNIAVVSAPSDTGAIGNDNVVLLAPKADCWIAIGPNPVAVKLSSTGTKTGACVPLTGGLEYQFAVERGDRVAVIAA